MFNAEKKNSDTFKRNYLPKSFRNITVLRNDLTYSILRHHAITWITCDKKLNLRSVGVNNLK